LENSCIALHRFPFLLFLLAHATVQMKMTTLLVHPESRPDAFSNRSRCECYQAVKMQSSVRCVAPEHLRRAFPGQWQAFAFGQVAHATAGAPKILSRPASATVNGKPAWIRTASLTNSANPRCGFAPGDRSRIARHLLFFSRN
jgi:hypothetical protein